MLKNQEITELNEAWAADITYIDLGREFVYLAVIIDVCSRAIRGWYWMTDDGGRGASQDGAVGGVIDFTKAHF